MTAKQTYCEGCGRDHLTIHRVYKDRPYCGACYKRLFVRSLCPKCGNFARLPSFHAQAVCSSCLTSAACIRCKRIGRPVGKLTLYGPACASCAPYFTEQRPCDRCSKPSGKLSRHGESPDKLCPTCYSRATRGTCQACRKNRVLTEAADGRQVCHTCLSKGKIPCPKCGQEMPAGQGKQCVTCAAQASLERQLKFDLAAFGSETLAAAYSEFGLWLGQEIGQHIAAFKLRRFLPFFLELEAAGQGIPTYEALLKQFGAEGLRRVRLPMRWLAECRGVQPHPVQRQQDSEERRIAALLATVPKNTSAAKSAADYHSWLQARRERGRTSVASVRLALSPAVRLLIHADSAGEQLPSQKQLDTFVRLRPGQRAALTGFINYLNRHREDQLQINVDLRAVQEGRRKKLEAQVLNLVRSSEENPVPTSTWLQVALPYFHGVTINVSKLKPQQIEIGEDGSFTVIWGGQRYWVPPLNAKKGSERSSVRDG